VAAAGALAVFAAPVSAAAWALDFQSETWDHSAGGGPAASTGWAAGELVGTTTVNGITITAEFGFVGDTIGKAHSLNATYYDHPPEFVGLLWGLKSDSGLNTAPTLANYATFTLTFDQPVTGGLKVADFDQTRKWMDGGGFEAFNGTIGAIGTGRAPDTTTLGSNVASFTNDFQIETYHTSVEGSHDLGPDNTVSVAWGQPFTAIRGYFYNAQTGPDAGKSGAEFGVGIISSGSAVPEPGALSALSLLVFGGLALLRQRRQ
jgi:hypothetical protein